MKPRLIPDENLLKKGPTIMCKEPKDSSPLDKTQLQEIKDQLCEVQRYFHDLSNGYGRDPTSTKFTRWANALGTTRVLLDVFSDEWAQSVTRGIPPDDNPINPP